MHTFKIIMRYDWVNSDIEQINNNVIYMVAQEELNYFIYEWLY